MFTSLEAVRVKATPQCGCCSVGKGANLAEMSNLDIPVPPGFTISTEVCKLYYENDKRYPTGLDKQIDENLVKLENALGAKFGDN